MAQTCPYCDMRFTEFDLIFVATHYPIGIKCGRCTKTIKIPLLVYLGYIVIGAAFTALLFVVVAKILFLVAVTESTRTLALLASIVLVAVAVYFSHRAAMILWIASHRK